MFKKTVLLLLLVPAIAVLANSNRDPLHVDTYKVDVKSSTIEWTGEKVSGKHSGTINLLSGELYNNHGKFGGKFTIDMNSITVTDLTGDKKAKLEGHLKSDDFFGVKTFPTATFEITSLAPLAGVNAGEPNFNVTGKLTIKGKTNDISFPANIKFDGPNMTATGEVKVDRSKYDVRYGSKTFYADIGDKAISDEFVLKINLKASM